MHAIVNVIECRIERNWTYDEFMIMISHLNNWFMQNAADALDSEKDDRDHNLVN